MVHQVRRRLGHAPRVARRAHPAALAGEGDKKIMRAVITPNPRKTVIKPAALHVLAKCLLDIGRWCVVLALAIELAGAAQCKAASDQTKVKSLRADGEKFHKEGKHADSMKALAEARKILAI